MLWPDGDGGSSPSLSSSAGTSEGGAVVVAVNVHDEAQVASAKDRTHNPASPWVKVKDLVVFEAPSVAKSAQNLFNLVEKEEE